MGKVNAIWNDIVHKMDTLWGMLQNYCSVGSKCFNILNKYSLPLKKCFVVISIANIKICVEIDLLCFNGDIKYNYDYLYKLTKDENIINSIKLDTTSLVCNESIIKELFQPNTEAIEWRQRCRYSRNIELNLDDYYDNVNEYTSLRDECNEYIDEGDEAIYRRQRSRCRDMRFGSYNRWNYCVRHRAAEEIDDCIEEIGEEGEHHMMHEEEEDHTSIFVPNDNIEPSAYNADIDKVLHKIKLDTNQMYANVSDHFDDFYPSEDVDLLVNEDRIDEGDVVIQPDSDEDDGAAAADDDDDDDEHVAQIQGHKEVIGGKTYLLPRNTKNIGPVFGFGKQWAKNIQPKYQHLKEEVLNNEYAPLTEKTWNAILVKCHRILKGEFASKKRNRWSKLLKKNKIGMKHLVALKLYTDFDLLQREFRKSFRSPYNQNKERLEAFYHWRQALQDTFRRFSSIPSAMVQPPRLFHGINSIMCLDQYKGVYYGPCSTTTDLQVARAFAGKNGMILVMKPERDLTQTDYKVLDISWISDYPDEREYLLFDHHIEIETWILTSDFDEFYHYYWNILANGKRMKEPCGHLSYQKQTEVPKHLNQLKQLVDDVPLKDGTFKQNVEFDGDVMSDGEKINLLMWMFQFALGYKYGKKKPSKYDQTLNANLQHAMKQIHIMQVPSKLVLNFMEKLSNKYKEEFSAYFISSVLNGYFRNTYCKLLI